MPTNILKSAQLTQHHRFHFLDALRGIAAIVVVFRHAPWIYAEHLFTTNSFLAVDFFGLSGFVIAFAYEERLEGSLDFKQFVVARIIRLYPIAAIGTLLGAIELAIGWHLHGMLASSMPFLFWSTVLGLLVVPYPSHDIFPLDGVMWTLFFELVANFIYAALVRSRMAGSRFLLVLAAVAAGALAWERIKLGTIDLGNTLNMAHVGFTRVALSFLLGVLTFRLYRRYASRQAGRKSSSWAMAILFVFVFVLCGPGNFTHLPALELPLLIVGFPLVLYLGSLVSPSPRWTPLCAILGAVSYPLYVLHPPLLWPLFSSRATQFGLAHHRNAAPTILLVYAAFMVLLSWIASEYYDVPVRRMLANTYKRKLHSEPTITTTSH